MTRMQYDKKTLEAAIREVSKKMKLKSVKQRNELLSFAADDMAEAYEIGAEEAQEEMRFRLRQLAAKTAPETQSK